MSEMGQVDYHWATLNLMQGMDDLGLCAKRLRSIACQKSVPKPKTIKRWVSFGELHRESLQAQLKQVKSHEDFLFVELNDGETYSKEKIVSFIRMFQSSIEFYEEAGDRALRRLKKPKKQFFAGF